MLWDVIAVVCDSLCAILKLLLRYGLLSCVIVVFVTFAAAVPY